ncbi:MAG TPA: hypothetical protein PK156_11515 [Polyangium sp.]|nr:hypothetical protein [Polyangium sp.]
MSKKDPTVEEIHKVREAIAKQADYDLDRIVEAARSRQNASDHPVIRIIPKKPIAIDKAS